MPIIVELDQFCDFADRTFSILKLITVELHQIGIMGVQLKGLRRSPWPGTLMIVELDYFWDYEGRPCSILKILKCEIPSVLGIRDYR